MASQGNGRSSHLDSTITCKLAARRIVPRYGAHVTSERFLILPQGYLTLWSRSRSLTSLVHCALQYCITVLHESTVWSSASTPPPAISFHPADIQNPAQSYWTVPRRRTANNNVCWLINRCHRCWFQHTIIAPLKQYSQLQLWIDFLTPFCYCFACLNSAQTHCFVPKTQLQQCVLNLLINNQALTITYLMTLLSLLYVIWTHSTSIYCQRLEFCYSVAHFCCLLPLIDRIERQCPTIGWHYSEVGGSVGAVSASGRRWRLTSDKVSEQSQPRLTSALCRSSVGLCRLEMCLQQRLQRLLVLKHNTFEITTTAWSTTLSTKKSHCWAVPVEGFLANGTSLLPTSAADVGVVSVQC